MTTQTYPSLTHLTDTGVITIHGDNAMEFLQGQLTCDMREVTQHKTRFAAYCNRQGRIQTSCRVYYLDDKQYLLSLPRNQVKNTIATLNKYGRFSNVTIEDASTNWQCYGVLSEEALLATRTNTVPQQTDDCCGIETGFITKLISHPDINRYEILVKKPGAPQVLWDPKQLFIENSKITILNDLADWHYHTIRSGVAIIDKPAANLFLPHHINYHLIHAINVKKGCYLGQEIITRMHHLGKLKQHGYYAVLNTKKDQLSIQCNDPIVNINNPDKTVGHVINVVYYDNAYHLFASIQDKACGDVLVLADYLEAGRLLVSKRLTYDIDRRN